MNKLSPEHLHLLLDEPIYVLESDLREHFEGHETIPETKPTTDQIKFKGENKKGILIISQEALVAEDEEFLFKGLSALEICARDVAIIIKPADAEIPLAIDHSKRISFNTNPDEEVTYQIKSIEDIMQLECHSINKIRLNKDLKVSFWQGLKAIFTVPA